MHAFLHVVFVATGAILALAALPLFADLLVLSLAAALPPRRHPTAASQAFRLAVIVPAHNEELLIATCVRSLLAAAQPSTGLFVIAHNCTDATAAAARTAGATVIELNDKLGGKGLALDHGFRHALARGAQGALVIDADSIVSPNLLDAVATHLAAGAPALQCRYEVSNAEANPRTRLAALAFLGMNVLRPRGRDRLGLSCGIFGNGFALAAATLQQVPYTANSLVEDLEYHLHLVAAGLPVTFVDEATVFGEMPVASAASATQRARWEGGRQLMRNRWSRPLAAEVARGHLRLLEPLLDLLAVPLATESALLAATLAVALLAHTPALTLYATLGLLTLILYVAVAASLAPNPGATLKALAAAPAYLFWKLLQLPHTRRATRTDAPWVRTKRNDETP